MENLQKLLVPYELALKLKEKGFDDETLFQYYEDRNGNILLEPTTLSHTEKELRNLSLLAPAPLYQQVLNWFRKKHNLHIIIDLQVCNPTHWYFRIDDIQQNDFIYHSEDHQVIFEIENYDEALNESIKTAIEFI